MPRPEPRHPAPRRLSLPGGAVLGMIIAAGVWLHRSVLRAPFFADDYLFLDQVRHRSLPAALVSPDPIGNFVRPVGRQLHFWWLAHASAESPVAFHAANLVLFALALGLMFALARRLAGGAAAAIAVGYLALHYAADVPLEWASGSQDLLALTLALAAIVLHVGGRRWPAALAFLLAMLSKETVIFTPLVAALLDRGGGDGWRVRARRVWPLGAAGLAWGALWLGAMAGRHGPGAGLAPDATGIAAALAHLLQVTAGLEWRTGGGPAFVPAPLPWGPLALVAAAVALGARERGRRAGPESSRPAPARRAGEGRRPAGGAASRPAGNFSGPVVAGLAWAVLGALPVAAVAGIWSAYYFLFALCGVALALGASLSRAPRVIAVGAVILLAWGSQEGRTLDEFATAPGAWTAQSHVNRFYVQRSMRVVSRYLEALRRARPTLPHDGTVFFFGIPPNVAWQTGSGPVVRWAYRDSSLRSYYLNTLTAARAGRGPDFFFRPEGDSLIEVWRGRRPWEEIALSVLLEDRDSTAREALHAGLSGAGEETHYMLGLLAWSAGDTAEALRELDRAGMTAARGPTPEAAAARRVIAAGGDTLAAAVALEGGLRRHALDADAHALFSDILLTWANPPARAYLEALAARILAPGDPRAWRRWAMVQMKLRRYPEAERTLGRYFALGGKRAEDDAEAQSWRAALRQLHPGTALAQRSIRGAPRGDR